jgi:hypothetical protein
MRQAQQNEGGEATASDTFLTSERMKPNVKTKSQYTTLSHPNQSASERTVDYETDSKKKKNTTNLTKPNQSTSKKSQYQMTTVCFHAVNAQYDESTCRRRGPSG